MNPEAITRYRDPLQGDEHGNVTIEQFTQWLNLWMVNGSDGVGSDSRSGNYGAALPPSEESVGGGDSSRRCQYCGTKESFGWYQNRATGLWSCDDCGDVVLAAELINNPRPARGKF